MEIWDLFDENREPLGRFHNRCDAMVIGEYHIVVDVWTVNSKREILLTLRHPDKEMFPNLWENTGGSILAGETSRQGAVRELLEETGISSTENELVFLGSLQEETAFIDSYIVKKDIEIEDLIMQDGETVDAQWVSLSKLDELISDGSVAYPVANRLEPVRGLFEEFLSAVT